MLKIGKHINNALKEECNDSVVAKFATTAADGKVYQTEHYNLDMIISVGYRVKSNRGVEFRKWANNVLKRYIIQGYAVNERLLTAQGKTIELQARSIAGSFEGEETEVLRAVSAYTDALTLLDNYDHQVLSKPDGIKPVYRIAYEECRNMINHMGICRQVGSIWRGERKGESERYSGSGISECIRPGTVSNS